MKYSKDSKINVGKLNFLIFMVWLVTVIMILILYDIECDNYSVVIPPARELWLTLKNML